MRIGKVVSSVEIIQEDACLQGQTFLVIQTGEEEIVAADRVGAVPGNRVLLAMGSTASRYCMEAPVDAAVVAVVEEKPYEKY